MKELMLKSPYPWWQWDTRENAVTFSPLKATMIGYDPSDFSGKGYQAFTALVHHEDLENTMAAMTQVLMGQAELYQIDYRIRDRSGLYHWYMDRGVVVEKTPDNRPKIIRGIVIDIGKEGEVSGSPELSRLVILNSLLASAQPKSFLTVCAACKKVKAKSRTYVEVTPDLLALLSEETSHGICPACMKSLYPELEELRSKKHGLPSSG